MEAKRQAMRYCGFGYGGAQPLAITMAEGVCLAAEVEAASRKTN